MSLTTKKSNDSLKLKRQLIRINDQINNLINCWNDDEVSLSEIDEYLCQISSIISLRNHLLIKRDQSVHQNYVFETFVEGECNKIARSYAMSATESKKSKVSNPLLITGSVGSGKTHLLQAILNKVKTNDPDDSILYLESEVLYKQMVNAIKNDRYIPFMIYLSKQRILIIDDIHCLKGKEQAQNLLVQVIDNNIIKDLQIIFSSTIPPSKVENFDDQLLSRISKGLVVNLSMADSQTLEKILKMEAKHLEIKLTDSILKEVLSIEHHSIREAEGYLINLIAKATNEGTR